MPKMIHVTYDFTEEAEALAFLQGRGGTGRVETTPAAPAATGRADEAASQVGGQAPAQNGTAAATDAPNMEAVTEAFKAYVNKKGGRTAATGKKILEQHGANSIREAKPEQYQALITAFETA